MIALAIKLAVSGFVVAGFIFAGAALVEVACAIAARRNRRIIQSILERGGRS